MCGMTVCDANVEIIRDELLTIPTDLVVNFQTNNFIQKTSLTMENIFSNILKSFINKPKLSPICPLCYLEYMPDCNSLVNNSWNCRLLWYSQYYLERSYSLI